MGCGSRPCAQTCVGVIYSRPAALVLVLYSENAVLLGPMPPITKAANQKSGRRTKSQSCNRAQDMGTGVGLESVCFSQSEGRCQIVSHATRLDIRPADVSAYLRFRVPYYAVTIYLQKGVLRPWFSSSTSRRSNGIILPKKERRKKEATRNRDGYQAPPN